LLLLVEQDGVWFALNNEVSIIGSVDVAIRAWKAWLVYQYVHTGVIIQIAKQAYDMRVEYSENIHTRSGLHGRDGNHGIEARSWSTVQYILRLHQALGDWMPEEADISLNSD